MEGARFSGKQVLITGGSRGIGAAIAEAFLEQDGTVAILSSTDSIHTVADTLSNKFGRQVRAIRCDIADAAAVGQGLQILDRIDVLINNAGLELITPIDDTSDEVARRFKQIIDINVMGTYYVTRTALPLMPAGGRIVITSSIWGKTAVAEFSAYCASKHANIGFMRSLAQELAPKRITVNAVCPGWVKTDAAMRSLKVMAERDRVSEEALLTDFLSNQAIGGLLEPKDVTAPYLFLASEMAADITGQSLHIDRGEVMS